MREVDRLRAEAKKFHRRAGSKISRLKRQGLAISQTPSDPRRSIDAVNRMNTPQLKKYIERLSEFNSRNSMSQIQIGNDLTTMNYWAAFQREQSRLNSAKKKMRNEIDSLYSPADGMTIGEIRAIREETTFPVMGTAAGYDLKDTHKRAQNINGVDSMKQIIKDMRKSSDDIVKIINDRNRETISKFFDQMGTAEPEMVRELKGKLDGLNEFQFFVMTSQTNFMENLSIAYEHAKLYEKDEDDSPFTKDTSIGIVNDQFNILNERADYASSMKPGKRKKNKN